MNIITEKYAKDMSRKITEEMVNKYIKMLSLTNNEIMIKPSDLSLSTR